MHTQTHMHTGSLREAPSALTALRGRGVDIRMNEITLKGDECDRVTVLRGCGVEVRMNERVAKEIGEEMCM